MSPPPLLSAIFVFLLCLLSTADSEVQKPRRKVPAQRRVVVLESNATISSENGTFELGFFSPDKGKTQFLGICYSSISPPTYIWVANRKNPIKNLSAATLELTETGRLEIRDAAERSVLWRSENSDTGTEHRVELFETGNLALVSARGSISWQSFDFPTDTWLPGMNLTAERGLLSWRSEWDPSPGLYSLRMRPGFGEFELVFNDTEPFWRTGNWTGNSFSNVPEMMIPYIYRFRFDRPYEETASFGFSERDLNNGLGIQLTRFRVDPSGMFRQFTLSAQTESWNMFWSQPAGTCMVFGTCGEFGICGSEKPCACLSGFEPVDHARWDSGDYSDGCRRRRSNENDGIEGVVCWESDDRFEKVGALRYESQGNYDNASIGFRSSLGDCKASCLKSCDCVGLYHNDKTNLCRMLNQTLLTLRNLSLDTHSDTELVYIRVPKEAILNEKNNKKKLSPVVLAATVVGSIAVLGFLVLALLFLCRRRLRKMSTGEEDQEEVKPKGEEGQEESVLPLLTLRVFSYKELHNLTNGFSEKLGQGGFGTVFKGELPDSSAVAVKRLERPGGGEKEFRAEVRTIGNIHHLNLVRLRGFCSEDAHRLLVYDYMRNGALSLYLREPGPALSWETRFRVAVGTARGIAYLHEGCRDCIIHCDIKPENILLDGDLNPKVSDFGLAKLLGRDFSRVAATMRGTWGYVAPEWISGVAITSKADVYSYGMTMIELIGGRRNVDSSGSGGGGGGGEGRGGEKWFFPPWAAGRMIEGDVGAVVDPRLGGDYDLEEARRVGLVAVWCIQDDEAARPTMGTVVKMLEGVVDVVVPPAPKLLQALVSGESFRGGVSPEDNRSGGGGGSETSEGCG